MASSFCKVLGHGKGVGVEKRAEMGKGAGTGQRALRQGKGAAMFHIRSKHILEGQGRALKPSPCNQCKEIRV